MQVMVRKWGNSASVRIPAAILQAAQLSIDQMVEIREEGGCIVIEPSRQPAIQLAELLAGISAYNLHGEADLGPRVGQEML